MFNFNSFRAMVDTIGGVEVCVPRSGYHDPFSGLNLSGGKHLLTYNQALAYVRTRHGVHGRGRRRRRPAADRTAAGVHVLGHPEGQQPGILTNSVQLLKIADLATRALTVDQGLNSVSKLLGLAKSLTGLHAKNVTLLTMPTVTDPANVNRLLPEEPEDDVIFQMLLDGQPWHHRLPVSPISQVKVRVLNGTGTPGLATQTARQLRALGFDVTGTGDAPATSATTVTLLGHRAGGQRLHADDRAQGDPGRAEPAGRAGPADRPAGRGHADPRQPTSRA